MVSGYVGSRLRVADFSYGTNSEGRTYDANKVQLTIQHVSASSGTNIYFQVNQSQDDSPTGTRSALTPNYLLNVMGNRVVDFTVSQPIIEIKCTGGQGNIRAQVVSRLKWEQMAMDRTDPFGAPQVWNKKWTGPGAVAPATFPI
jgi:hypothetical protein